MEYSSVVEVIYLFGNLDNVVKNEKGLVSFVGVIRVFEVDLILKEIDNVKLIGEKFGLFIDFFYIDGEKKVFFFGRGIMEFEI